VSAKVGEYRKLPGPKGKKLLERAKRVLVTTVQNRELSLGHRGYRGMIVKDPDGNDSIDFFSGAGVSNLGHKHPRVTRAVRRQLSSGAWQYDASVFINDPLVEWAEKLVALTPGNHEKLFFPSNSGTEAVEAALKVCLANRRDRRRFIAFEGAFHGRTLGSLALNASKSYHKSGFPAPFPVHHFPFPDHRGALDGMMRQVGRTIPTEEINAVVLELVQGEGGVNVVDKAELARLIHWCRSNDVYIVVDEVQTGFGRTGTFFACEQFDFIPDIITVAKALTNGAVPAGGTIIAKELDFPEQGCHANTGGGNMLACAASLAVIEEFTKDSIILDNVREQGEYLQRRLGDVVTAFNEKVCKARSKTALKQAPHLSEPRGLGLMRAVDVEYEDEDPRDRIVSQCFRRGLVIEGTGEYGLRFLPPLIVTREDIDMAMSILEDALLAAFSV